jgi:hypothetical protein
MLAATVEILIGEVNRRSQEGLSPAERTRLAAVLRWLAAKIEPERKVIPFRGVLCDLNNNGGRSD